jgi:hypothetical protein
MSLNLIKLNYKKNMIMIFFTVVNFSVFSTIEAKIRDVNIFLSCVKFSVFYHHTTIKDIEVTSLHFWPSFTTEDYWPYNTSR